MDTVLGVQETQNLAHCCYEKDVIPKGFKGDINSRIILSFHIKQSAVEVGAAANYARSLQQIQRDFDLRNHVCFSLFKYGTGGLAFVNVVALAWKYGAKVGTVDRAPSISTDLLWTTLVGEGVMLWAIKALEKSIENEGSPNQAEVSKWIKKSLDKWEKCSKEISSGPEESFLCEVEGAEKQVNLLLYAKCYLWEACQQHKIQELASGYPKFTEIVQAVQPVASPLK